jgi:hypothetical protein
VLAEARALAELRGVQETQGPSLAKVNLDLELEFLIVRRFERVRAEARVLAKLTARLDIHPLRVQPGPATAHT